MMLRVECSSEEKRVMLLSEMKLASPEEVSRGLGSLVQWSKAKRLFSEPKRYFEIYYTK